MKRLLTITKHRGKSLYVLTGLALCLQSPFALAERLDNTKGPSTSEKQRKVESLTLDQRALVTYDAYILGPADSLQIEVLDLPELSGRFSIGPDGTLYLPRLRALYVEGLTVEELRNFLTQKFRTYIRNPQIYIRPVVYRPIRIYIGGEVQRPGYYTLSNATDINRLSESAGKNKVSPNPGMDIGETNLVQIADVGTSRTGANGLSTFTAVFPTVFDAIRAAQGVTPYSDLAKVQVTRRRAEGLGGGKIRANLNFLSLLTEGNESQNIRLFDGDVVRISKSPDILRDQLLKAGQTNLSPQFINVFVSGRVNMPGSVTIPQGSSLNQAIELAGGTRILKGKVEFIRFTREGTIKREIFSYKPSADSSTSNNPLLMPGDLIRVKNSPLTAAISVINEVTTPVVSIYSSYSLFNLLLQ